MVSADPAEADRTVSSADARPQYTRTSATASSSSRAAVFGQGLMVPGEGSVAPVHSGRDLADYRAPPQTRLLRPDFTELATTEETAHSATFRGPQGLVQ